MTPDGNLSTACAHILIGAAALTALATLGCAWRGWWAPASLGAVGTGLLAWAARGMGRRGR